MAACPLCPEEPPSGSAHNFASDISWTVNERRRESSMCNSFNGCSWIIIIILILLCSNSFGGCGCGTVNNCGNGCGNDCGCGNGCGC